MNASPSIFDPFAVSANGTSVSPFSSASEAPASNPFAAAPMTSQSPFAAMPDEVTERQIPEPGKPAKIPAPRLKPVDSPFQLAADPQGAFGYEAPSPFTTVASPAPAPVLQNPFSQVPPAMAPAPFPAAAAPVSPSPWTASPSVFPATSHAETRLDSPTMHNDYLHNDYQEASYNYRQLELRAIFGVDREMTAEEILQRTRSLPGIRHVARIPSQEVIAVENLRRTLQGMGFGQGAMRIYSGTAPIEFVRESGTTLAVQTDGGFAPGVRETIMIVARELDKIGPL